jgi:hypothetical protein
MFAVDLATGACTQTAFAGNLLGTTFVTSADRQTESFFVVPGDTSPFMLETLDVQTFTTSLVGPLPALKAAEDVPVGAALSGTGDGRLFGLGYEELQLQMYDFFDVREFDPTTAAGMTDRPVPVGQNGGFLAFAFWGGELYFFLDEPGATTATVGRIPRAAPVDASYATLPLGVVSAASSTCAPLD